MRYGNARVKLTIGARVKSALNDLNRTREHMHTHTFPQWDRGIYCEPVWIKLLRGEKESYFLISLVALVTRNSVFFTKRFNLV